MLTKTFKKPILNELLKKFNEIGEDAFYKTHYMLAAETEFNANLWREFLMDPEVAEYIDSELNIVQGVELRAILRSVSTKKGGVATAQLITALSKLDANAQKKSGDTFIYCYTPVNSKEAQAANVKIMDEDPFLKED